MKWIYPTNHTAILVSDDGTTICTVCEALCPEKAFDGDNTITFIRAYNNEVDFYDPDLTAHHLEMEKSITKAIRCYKEYVKSKSKLQEFIESLDIEGDTE